MKVLFFSSAAEIAGTREEEWKVQSSISLSEFWEEATRRHPGLQEIRDRCQVANGMEVVFGSEVIDPKKETAILPPVSGG